ncbi:DoxX family protein [Nocardioides lijunqiniae]|uniref:DoxX family protein n=1 Tax=Nocardioides lijunqiniae TaxID=2760832 RepID=UPI00187843B7|nr:DoxX family protein [Nocardioides lijunqiniae]
MSLTPSTRALAAIFAVSGAVHLARPEVYEPLMPRWVPRHREVILGSGAAELALAAGLLMPATRRVAGWGSIALLLGVYPGNVKMAMDSTRSRRTGIKVAAFGRLPLQWPMLKAAYAATKG